MSRLQQLEKLLSADPSDADVPYMIAHEHLKAGDHGEATRWFDRCLAIDPHYHYAYFHKAKALEAAGDVPAAAAALRLGVERARAARDAKALNELSGYLDEIA
ncbi:MAG: tetratricopeptide repeat protein [Phycisphaerales bacterium]|nr:tetratricopeptide repeat protein [Phycisphaerales bacterium]